MARVVSIATDLMLASRVDAGLTAAGHDVVLARSVEGAPLDGGDAIVADLDVADPAALAATGVPVLGYYSHVDVDTKAARRRRRPGQGRPPLADVARTAGPGRRAARCASHPGRQGQPLPRSKASCHVERLRQQVVGARPGGPFLQHRFVEGFGMQGGEEDLQLRLAGRPVRGSGSRRGGRRAPSAGSASVNRSRGGSPRPCFDQLRFALQLLARRRQDQLGVVGRAVFVDFEDAQRDALALGLDRLGVPEAGRGVDLARRPARRPR